MSTSLQRTIAAATVTVVVSLLVVCTGGPAVAHTGLQSSAPADGDTLTAAPDAVILTFGTAVAAGFTQVAVTGPDGQSVASGEATVDGAVVTQPVATSGDGLYTVAYRVVSDDGHPVSGELSFTLSGTGASATEPSATEPSATEPSATEPSATESPAAESTAGGTSASDVDPDTRASSAAESGGAGSWGLWLLLLAVALAFVVGSWLALRRRGSAGG